MDHLNKFAKECLKFALDYLPPGYFELAFSGINIYAKKEAKSAARWIHDNCNKKQISGWLKFITAGKHEKDFKYLYKELNRSGGI